MLPSLRRYKTGFDRLGIVLFVLVAAGFGLFVMLAGEPYVAPPPDSPAGLALAEELHARCGGDAAPAAIEDTETDESAETDPLALLCREQVWGEHRLRHYEERFALEGWGLAIAIPAALAGLAFLVWGLFWIRAGFRQAGTGENG